MQLPFALIALVIGVAVGWALRTWTSRRAEADRLAQAAQEAQSVLARAADAEQRADTLHIELKQVTEQFNTIGIENARLSVHADRVAPLEQQVSSLQADLLTAQRELAAASMHVEQLSKVEQSLEDVQNRLLTISELNATLQAKADTIPPIEEKLLGEQRRSGDLQTALGKAEQENVRLTVELDESRTRLQEQLAILENVQTAFREAFQALSADALKSNNQAFLDLAKSALTEFQTGAKVDLDARKEAIEKLVSPVQESLTKFNSAVQDLETKRLEAYTELRTQVTGLHDGQKDLHDGTEKLVRALRAPMPRGKWGEFQLRRLMEMAGMTEHCSFEEQPNVPTEDGRLRPDVIVHLPGLKTSVIDSKVPLNAYLDACLEADDENKRRLLLKNHAANVKTHISQLASKAYWDQLPSSPDFVIMYVELESAFVAALEQDPSLIEFAVDSSVIPAGPMTLLTHLKAAAYGWRQERIAESAERISELGKELHTRLVTFVDHFIGIGKHLDGAIDAYNSAAGSLERRVLIQARRFKELGAAPGDEIPTPEPIVVSPRQLEAAVSAEDDPALF